MLVTHKRVKENPCKNDVNVVSLLANGATLCSLGEL